MFFNGVIKLKIKKNIILLTLLCITSTSFFSNAAVVSWVGKIKPLVAVPETVSVKGDTVYWKENGTEKKQLIISNLTFNVVKKEKIAMISLSL